MAKGSDKTRIHVDLPTHDARKFKARTAEYGVSMAEVIRPVIEEFMKTHPQKIEKLPRVD